MQGRRWPWAALLLGCLASVCAAQEKRADVRPSPMSQADRLLSQDADLADVHFVDTQRGWAVGDRGVIWHTADGGRHWNLQPSGVDCRLESVHFIDAERGWVVGHRAAPYTHASQGVLLKTENGGRTWHRDRALVLPALRHVKFFSAASGWVLGDTSALFSSGVFVTNDGGRTWIPLAGDVSGGWLAGDFLDPVSGAVAGKQAALATIGGRRLKPVLAADLGLRTARRLRLARPASGWLIGDGCLVMTTNDLGATWQPPAGELPTALVRHADFRALAVLGDRCWIAGTPGTRVLHSADGGRSWQLQNTGHRPPITALHFSDARHGWAVGALGAILHTPDGGITWHRQRSGGQRAAAYGIYADPSAVPLELFAQLSGNDGYLGRVQVIGRRDFDTSLAGAANLPERTHEALLRVGASGADTSWRFPLRDVGLSLPVDRLVADFDSANDGAGLDRLQEELVRNIRVWRPDVVFTHGASPRGDDPLGHLIHQVVVGAVEQAADAAWFNGEADQLGLEPWQVKKVYTGRPPGTKGEENLTPSQLAPRLGRSLAEHTTTPRGLLERDFTAAPPLLGFQLTMNRLPRGIGTRGFFHGIQLAPGGDARRKLSDLAERDLDQLRKMARRHRDLQAILSRTAEKSGTRLLAQVGEMTVSLPDENAGSVLFHLGQQFHRGGQWPLTAEVFELLARRYPDHPLTAPALVWLVQYWTSSEAAWRADGHHRLHVRQATAEFLLTRSTPAITRPSDAQQPAHDRATGGDNRQALDKPDQIAEMFQRLHGTLFAEPTVRFPLAAYHRRRQSIEQAAAYYRSVRSTRRDDAWKTCAMGELWLADAGGAAPKSVLHCAAALEKPRLDGRLQDAVWRAAQPVHLRSRLRDDADWPAAVRMACDEEFLYLAVECRRATDAPSEKTSAPRPRDADLAGHDRVEFYLDLDRDFATAWKLSVDHRGWTADACWGDSSWDPTWFVAADGDDRSWTVEVAIPWDQLTGGVPQSKTVWALGVQRIVPGVGLQSWTKPAATRAVPEGFGYLIFD